MARRRAVTMNRPTEAQCIDTIVEAAKTFGFLVYHARAARSNKGWVTATQGCAGFPDLVIVGYGRAWFVETKRKPNRPTTEQMAWATELVKAGLDARLLWVPEETDALLAELQARFERSRHPSSIPAS